MKTWTVALDHRLQPLSLWQHTKRMSPFAARARGAKELGRRRIAEAQHQRGLKRDGHSFDQSPSSGLAIGIGDFPLQFLDCTTEARVVRRGGHLSKVRRKRIRLALHGAQYIE